MDTSLCKLTLVIPKTIEAVLCDALERLDHCNDGYYLMKGQHRGSPSGLKTGADKVRGGAKAIWAVCVVPKRDVSTILDVVKQACHRTTVSYWTEPVLEFGRLG